MCNRFRSIHEWSEVPRRLQPRTQLNFAFNPKVAPTELVPVSLATSDGSPQLVIARFGINPNWKDGRPRPPLLNARMDGMNGSIHPEGASMNGEMKAENSGPFFQGLRAHR